MKGGWSMKCTVKGKTIQLSEYTYTREILSTLIFALGLAEDEAKKQNYQHTFEIAGELRRAITAEFLNT